MLTTSSNPLEATLNWIAIGFSVGIGLEAQRVVSHAVLKALEPSMEKLNTWLKEQKELNNA